MKLGPQNVFQNQIGIIYGRKFSPTDPNNVETGLQKLDKFAKN